MFHIVSVMTLPNIHDPLAFFPTFCQCTFNTSTALLTKTRFTTYFFQNNFWQHQSEKTCFHYHPSLRASCVTYFYRIETFYPNLLHHFHLHKVVLQLQLISEFNCNCNDCAMRTTPAIIKMFSSLSSFTPPLTGGEGGSSSTAVLLQYSSTGSSSTSSSQLFCRWFFFTISDKFFYINNSISP